MSAGILSPAVFFHPNAYDISAPKIMGRQSAGHGFLRALVAARGEGPVTGFGRDAAARELFLSLVAEIDPAAPARWLDADADPAEFERLRVCHRPDIELGQPARYRLRQGPAAYCLTGVTHTLSSSHGLEAIAALLTEPLEPWDALVCTSNAALEIARGVLQAQGQYLRWRLGPEVAPSAPQLPVIPLGVHAADFAFTAEQRQAARAAIGAGPDDVVALYAGRLLLHGKAHPYAMYLGLEAAAQAPGAKVRLVAFGRAPSAAIERAFREGAKAHAPSVETTFLDGAASPPAAAWASADLFVSLADSIQETFGLTPIEAMAGGLPCVVTDWNGYRDTVRDGIDGYRIRTAAPSPGAGAAIARAYEARTVDFDGYSWMTTASTAVDVRQLGERLSALAADPGLRRRMGEAGRARAIAEFDWSVVYRQYQALWTELDARRLSALEQPDELARVQAAPRAAAMHRDPFLVFAHYPSELLTPRTRLRPAPGATEDRVLDLAADPLFPQLAVGPELLAGLWRAIPEEGATLRKVARAAGCHEAVAIRAVGLLAKMDLISLFAG